MAYADHGGLNVMGEKKLKAAEMLKGEIWFCTLRLVIRIFKIINV